MLHLLAAGCALGIMASVYYWSPEKRKARALAKERAVFVSDFKDQSFAKVIGVVSNGETIAAPLSGRRCVLYVVTVEQSSGNDYRRVHFNQNSVEFSLVDPTGRAVVKTLHVEALLNNDHFQHSDIFSNANRRVLAYLEKHQLSAKAALGYNKSMRFREHIVEIGERIAVMGFGSLRPDPNPTQSFQDHAYRGAVSNYVLFDDHEVAVTISDEPSLIGSPPNQTQRSPEHLES